MVLPVLQAVGVTLQLRSSVSVGSMSFWDMQIILMTVGRKALIQMLPGPLEFQNQDSFHSK